MSQDSLGEIAYKAYCKSRGWKSVKTETSACYQQQSKEIIQAWEDSAIAVSEHISKKENN